MVSIMENGSDLDPTQAAAELAELQNLEMVGFVEAAKDPLWVWPAIGVIAGLFLASFEAQSGLVTALATMGYVLGIFALVFVIIRKRGVQPRITNMPGSLNRLFGLYALGSCALAAIVLGLGFGVNFIVAGIVAVPLISVGGIFYHLRWRTAVDGLVTA